MQEKRSKTQSVKRINKTLQSFLEIGILKKGSPSFTLTERP